MLNDTSKNNDPSYANIDEMVRCRFGARSLRNFPTVNAKRIEGGANRSQLKGRGMDFNEVRAYHPGDDARHIDWRVTAKTQKPHTKIYTEEKEKPIYVITDLRPSMFFGRNTLKSVTACHVSATLAWAGLLNDDRAGGIVFSEDDHEETKPKKSSRSVLKIIRSLQEFSSNLSRSYEKNIQIEQPYKMIEMLSEIRKIISPGCSIFIISDFIDLSDDCDKCMFELAKVCNVNLCHIFDSFEAELPLGGVLGVGKGLDRMNLHTGNKSMREKYKNVFNYRINKLSELTDKLSAGLISLETNGNYLNTLALHFGAGRIRHKGI